MRMLRVQVELLTLARAIDRQVAAGERDHRQLLLGQRVSKHGWCVAELVERAVACTQLDAAISDRGDVVDRLRDRAAPRDRCIAVLDRWDGAARVERTERGSEQRQLEKLSSRHHECTVPSSRRFTGRYAGSYGYRAASVSSMSTPSPGASPGYMAPRSKVYPCGNTRSVSSVWRMYSCTPKLWTLMSKCSAPAIATGLRSV